jgi:TolA-binding protein
MWKKFLFVIVIFVPFLLHGFTQERELYSQAQSRYLSNNYTAAYESFDELVRRYPLSDLVPDAQYWKAVCLFRLGSYDEAIELFSIVERRYRATRFIGFVPFWKGVAHFQKRSYIEALENLDEFLKGSDESTLVTEALLYKAMAEVEIGRFSDARTTMEKLRELKGDEQLSPYETVLFSFVLLNLDRYTEFLQFTDGIDIQQFPAEWREKITLFRAEANMRFGNTEAAEIDYTKLIDSDVETAAVALRRLYHIASLEQDFARKEWVVQHAEERLRTYPEALQDFWVRIGIESYRRGEYDLSEYFLSKVWNLKVTDNIPEAVPLYLSQLYMKNDRKDDARELMEEYLTIVEEDEKAVISSFSLGNIYLYEERYGEAAVQFRRTMELDPEGDLARNSRYLLAYSSYKEEQLMAALQLCDEYLEAYGIDTESNITKTLGADELSLTGNVVRLKSRILQALGKNDEAHKLLSSFTAQYRDAVRARVDLIKLNFFMNDFDAVVEQSDALLRDRPLLHNEDPYASIMVLYLRGLGNLAMKQYQRAAESLAQIDARRAEETGLSPIVPYVIYYSAWSRYRLNNLDSAIILTNRFGSEYEGHALYPAALYLGGWSRYSRGEYAGAEEQFAKLASMDEGELSRKARFLQGMSQKSRNQNIKASYTFSRIFEQDPRSSFADDALYEYANVLRTQDKAKTAADFYLQLWNTYPESPLAGEALFLRGEIYIDERNYVKARDAFRKYRVNFPYGKLVDASLYWEGVSSSRIGEERASALLWEEVILSHPESTFRPDAMRGAAEAYVLFGEYTSAYNLYADLIREYPVYSKSVRAEQRMEEIRYLKFGLGEQEAELTARISRSGGVETADGRMAMIELARLYIYEQSDKQDRAYQLLSQVLQHPDPETGAAAGVLLGEYYYGQGDLERASQEFFQASLKNPSDRDLMAYAIYRAAQAMKEAGNMREAAELVKRLRENFPSSAWADEGEKLLEDGDE